MSMYWSKKISRLRPYVPGEQPRGGKVIKLNTNENPYPPSPAVIEAIQKAAPDSLRLYPDPTCMKLREAIGDHFEIMPEDVFVGNGSDEILAFAFAAFFQAGDESLLFPDVTYSFYPAYAELWEIPYKLIPVRDDFSIDIQPYLIRSEGVILANPNAPTGIALPLEEIKRAAGAAKWCERVLVVDEAYISFADGEGMGSAVALKEEFPNVLVVRTLSKDLSLAGLRVGYALGHIGLIEGLSQVRDSFNSYTMDSLAQAGATAAIKDTAYYNEITQKIINTRNRVSTELTNMNFQVLPSQANFLFFSPPLESGKSAAIFHKALRDKGIVTRYFNKARIANYIRVSIGTDEEMDSFLGACREIIGK